MCFTRKPRTPMPFEGKGQIEFIDFRGCFETDDGGRRAIRKVGFVSAVRIFDRENWPDCKSEEDPRHSDFDWISPEDAIEAEPDGEPTASLWDLLEGIPACTGDEEQQDKETLDEKEMQFGYEPDAIMYDDHRREMCDPEGIQKWIMERYGDVILAMENNEFQMNMATESKTGKERQPKEKREIRFYRHHYQLHRRSFFLGIKHGKRPAQKQRPTLNDIRRQALKVETILQKRADQFSEAEGYAIQALKFLSATSANLPQSPSLPI